MPRQHIVIVGPRFAGFTAAMEMAKRFDGSHNIAVTSDREHFIFIPSSIRVPFGRRRGEDITFPLASVYGRRKIRFLHAVAILFNRLGIQAITDATIDPAPHGVVNRGDDQALPFKCAMLMSRFLGVDAVRLCHI